RSLAVLSEESTRLEALIDSVLSFSALESGARTHGAAVDLSGLVKECAELLRPAARAKGIHLTTDLPKDGASLQGDRELLKQLLLQLGVNAVKFTPKEARVTIGVAAQENEFRLWVKDTGIGIAPEECERVF